MYTYMSGILVCLLSRYLMVLWPIYAYTADLTQKPRVLQRDERGRWFFVFLIYLRKRIYLRINLIFWQTMLLLAVGPRYFGRERNVYITQWNYRCEMTDTIKNILNDRRTIITQFCRRLTGIILLLSHNVVPIYYYALEQILYPRLSSYHQMLLKCMQLSRLRYSWGNHRLCLYKSITYVCDIKSKSYSIFHLQRTDLSSSDVSRILKQVIYLRKYNFVFLRLNSSCFNFHLKVPNDWV